MNRSIMAACRPCCFNIVLSRGRKNPEAALETGRESPDRGLSAAMPHPCEENTMLNRLRRLARLAGSEITVLWFACRHPSTPSGVKLAALLLGLYVVSPIDLIPDAIPVLGWLDDATLLAFGIPALLRFLPADALADSRLASERLLARFAPWRRP
jgi:uncharacterized membrane protein YkvA (DUF1232 family)